MAQPTILFGNRNSGHVSKVRIALGLAGIAYEYREIDIDAPLQSRPAAFQEAARFGQVPTLVTQGRALTQSNAILCWIARSTGRFGAESEMRMQRVLEWLFWEANRIGMCLPQLRWARKYAPHEYTPGALDWLQSRFDADIARLDREFDDGRTFILDGDPTVADISLYGYLQSAEDAEVTLPAGVLRWRGEVARLADAATAQTSSENGTPS